MVTYYDFIAVPPGEEFDPTWGVAGSLVTVYSDFGITKDGSDRVGLWADQSGNGNDFSQATDSKKFVWYDNMLNGYPELQSDGVDDWMRNTISPNVVPPMTVFMVYRNIVPGPVNQHDGIFDGNSQYFLFYECDGGAPSSNFYGPTTNDFSNTFNELFSNNVYALFSMGIAEDGGATGYWRRNGSSFGTWAGAGDLTGIDGITLGVRHLFNSPSNCGFVAFLIFNSKLGDVDRATVENGLNTRYAIW